ncbi:MarR family winged helix-turn-helix transcriptional regulator [Yersinia intermedia]|jgi:DNA-binding MarR family transcriptional regulator|uniref:MarR family transcriptional regulator n=1 Tax=Yersinia intermedia TaxID=631 RepID=A0A209A9L5_YERIN|nr:MarR family winged helix-turn-helix transcriptional regulator [Yersinia intermedia]MCB5314216.1 MarR family winged helix-turn-helix transcriptional regulator [Yersinia intermedia]MCB5323807.1 MarR family winged helix-turn-helix transcriptional regulator [Yersinia intermedia]MCB5328070.1 MarR family winged helix-turn-helix transcriptional regulator [Yersinia intermedia]OVZ89422.1 MarR family transcriptional regulator [Yersinia intermedia]UNK21757.1 MarR family winged helix-turn-helix transcr
MATSKKAPQQEDLLLHQAIEQFYFGYRTFTELPDKLLAQRGLGRVHHRILYFVGHNPDIAINALLGILKISKQALNAPLKQLVKMELITVTTAEYDQRVRQLSLSPAGKKLESQLTDTQIQLLRQVFQQLGKETETAWLHVMQCLNKD